MLRFRKQAKHTVTYRLFMYAYEQTCHVGVNELLGIFQEKFWILEVVVHCEMFFFFSMCGM